MMNWVIWAFAVIFSSVSYQVMAKLLAGRLPLAIYMLVVSGTVFFISLMTLFVVQKTPLSEITDNKKILLFPIGIGIAGFLIDFSYYYLYKSGAPISLTRMIILAGIAVVLLLVGTIFFKERFSNYQVLGALLCLAGLYFIVLFKPKV